MLAPMTRSALIVNPFASGVTERRIEEVHETLGSPRLELTRGRGHATELARELCPQVDALYVFAGDGGFNEVLNGADADTALGLIPGGGTSVLPRALGIPRHPVRAAEHLLRGRTRRISLGRVNGRRFGFSAGVGFDAELVRRVDALGRSRDGRRSGDLAFAWAALRTVAERRGRFDPAIEIEGYGRVAFVLVANCDTYTYAGPVPLRLAPEARFELGLDVVAPREVRPQTFPRLLSYVARGQGQEEARDVLYVHDVSGVRITCDLPVPLQADGEDLGDVEEALFEAESDAVVVLI
jgi:diacylglycerol kinase family enzyme